MHKQDITEVTTACGWATTKREIAAPGRRAPDSASATDQKLSDNNSGQSGALCCPRVIRVTRSARL
jgi:hypothetical protein